MPGPVNSQHRGSALHSALQALTPVTMYRCVFANFSVETSKAGRPGLCKGVPQLRVGAVDSAGPPHTPPTPPLHPSRPRRPLTLCLQDYGSGDPETQVLKENQGAGRGGTVTSRLWHSCLRSTSSVTSPSGLARACDTPSPLTSPGLTPSRTLSAPPVGTALPGLHPGC